VGSTKSLTHDGGGDTHAIAQMVRYALANHGADESRVYAFGGSSGGMMTQALMGVYPDLFRAGVAVSRRRRSRNGRTSSASLRRRARRTRTSRATRTRSGRARAEASRSRRGPSRARSTP
jgi:poly(3-hydroxybutyrate) depolymerase